MSDIKEINYGKCPEVIIMTIRAFQSLIKITELYDYIKNGSQPKWGRIPMHTIKITLKENNAIMHIDVPTIIPHDMMPTQSKCKETLERYYVDLPAPILEGLLFTIQFLLFNGQNIPPELMKEYNNIYKEETMFQDNNELPF